MTYLDAHFPPVSLSFVQTRARATDSDTSHTAAKNAVTYKADAERATIIKCIRASAGLTAREVSRLTGLDYVETQRRISECGLIKTAEVRDGCRVWRSN